MTNPIRVTNAATARIAERCDRRHLATTRSVYFALLQLANDHRAEGGAFSLARKDVAARAGVSVPTLSRAAEVLVRAGLLTVETGTRGQPNRWHLLSLDDEAEQTR
jgi:hypothetical protein